MKRKVLFLDNVHPILTDMLREAGFDCEHAETAELTGMDLKRYFGLVLRSRLPVTKEVMESMPGLKFIGRVGAGMEGIDLEEAGRRGILCFNSPEGNRDALAEHTVMVLLALFNKLLLADPQVRKGIWDREGNRGLELMGKTFAIIGYGNMGSAVAQRLKGFGCRVIAYDKYKQGFGNDEVEEVQMEEVFREVDILSLHVPLTKETTYMVNKGYINSFKKDIFFINTARGQCVNTADLCDALEAGKVRGACLDVLEYEDGSFEKIKQEAVLQRPSASVHPFALGELQRKQNVILTPHVAGWTEESRVKLAKVLAQKIIKAFPLV